MRSLRGQLTAAISLTIACAIGLIAIGVLTGIRAPLQQSALDDLSGVAARISPEFGDALAENASAARLRELAAQAARRTTSRVSIVGIADSQTDRQLFTKADSAGLDAESSPQFPAALESAVSGRGARSVEAGPEGRVGEVAVPLRSRDDRVQALLVVSRPIPDAGPARAWAGRRIMVTGAIGLLIGLVVALALSFRIAARLSRLEQVARQVAAGDMTRPFPVSGENEFGGLEQSLEEMRGQLAELDSARKRFIATASHELRTPLFSLGGFLELLEDEDLSEADRRRFIGQLREQVTRMQDLATDLLDLSRIDSGSLDLDLQPVELRALARSVAAEFAPAISGHEAQLELRLPADVLHAECDAERTAQILRILIANAIRHTPKGTDLVIAVASRGERVRISVADYGPGIPRSVLPTIFEPFATTDDMHGTGLGLAIASELAGVMRGELRAESRPGLTRFTLDLEPAGPAVRAATQSGVR